MIIFEFKTGKHLKPKKVNSFKSSSIKLNGRGALGLSAYFLKQNKGMQKSSDNYTDLGIEILSMALDEICPKYRLPDRKVDDIEMAAIEEVQKLAAFLHKGHAFLIQERFDKRWEVLESGFEKKLKALVDTKQKIIAAVKTSDNGNRIDVKLQRAMDLWDKRRISLEKRIKTRRRTFKKKVSSQVDIKFTQDEVADLKVGLERSIAREIREFESKRETSLRKIRELRNSFRIEEKLVEKEVLYDLRIKKLYESYFRQQELFNKKWTEEDLQGAALDWFIKDVPQVNYYCTVALVPLKTCYNGVLERVKMLGFDTYPVDSILDDIRTGKISPETLPSYPFPPKYGVKNTVDTLNNIGYNEVDD